jgi:hypothetical protein
LAAWAGEDDARTSLFLRTGAIQLPGQIPTLFGGVPDSGSTLVPQTPADRGELAFCFDRTVPPSPEIMEAIERSVLNALNNFYQQGSRWPGSAGRARQHHLELRAGRDQHPQRRGRGRWPQQPLLEHGH